MALNREAFIGAKTALKEVAIPELGGSVYIKKWSAGDRVAYLGKITDIDGKDVRINYAKAVSEMVGLLQITLCDEAGKRLFGDGQEDYDILSAMDADIIQRLYETSAAYNGMTEDSETAAIKN